MEASESIVASDLYGKPIKIGTVVRYVTTRTLGKVTDLKVEDGKTWALVDSTQLYYDTHYLTVTDGHAVAEEDEDSVKVDLSDVEKRIKAMEEAMKVDEVKLDQSCEGGG